MFSFGLWSEPLFCLCRRGWGGQLLSCSLGAAGHSGAAWTLAPGRDILTSMQSCSLSPASQGEGLRAMEGMAGTGAPPGGKPGQATGILGLERH